MNYLEFEKELRVAVKRPLPGQEAQYNMVPPERNRLNLNTIDQNKVKKAAVAALFYEVDDAPHIILTLRNEYPGVHSGQISFPGGKTEEVDNDFKDTALRETCEEIGVCPSQVELLTELTSVYIPPSNFLVHPFVGVLKEKPTFLAEEKEVNTILSLDFNQFLHNSNVVQKTISTKTYKIKVPAFEINGHIIWGATAMMMSEIKEMFVDYQTS